MRKATNTQFQVRMNEAAAAQKAGQSKRQWVNGQVKKADSQVWKDQVRFIATLVW